MTHEEFTRLRSVYECLRKGRNAEAVKLLEPAIRDGYDPYPLFLAGIALLGIDQLERSLSITKRLKSYFPDYLPGRELELFVKLKSAASREDAAVACMETMFEFKENRHFEKIEKRVRKSPDFIKFQKKLRVLDCVRFGRYSPGSASAAYVKYREKTNKKKSRYWIGKIAISAVFLVVCGAVAVGYFKLSNKTPLDDVENKIDIVSIPDTKYPLMGSSVKDATYLYVDEETLRQDFNNAKLNAKEGQYNKSLITLNRILSSNAQPVVKDRVMFLREYIVNLDDRPAEDILMNLIVSNPDLYRGVMIRFTGTITKQNVRDGGSAFSVRSDDSPEIVAEVFSKERSDQDEGNHIKVEGKFFQMIGEKKQPYIEAKLIDGKK